jgi:hypothetical protein
LGYGPVDSRFGLVRESGGSLKVLSYHECRAVVKDLGVAVGVAEAYW